MRSWPNASAAELATLHCVDWFNNRRLVGPIGYITPAEAENNYYANIEKSNSAACLKKNTSGEPGPLQFVL